MLILGIKTQTTHKKIYKFILKMNPKYLFSLLFVVLGFFTLKAQNRFPTHFDDYYIVTDPDSLEEIVYRQQPDTEEHLHSLIALELSRNIFSEKLGQDVEKIEALTKQKACKTCLAMLNYLKGAENVMTDWGAAAAFFFRSQ
jgi:hypothetical protein